VNDGKREKEVSCDAAFRKGRSLAISKESDNQIKPHFKKGGGEHFGGGELRETLKKYESI